MMKQLLLFLGGLFGLGLMGQVSYNGNGNSGFGGAVGGANLSLTDDGTTITGTFTRGAGNFNDYLVIYIDNGSTGRTVIDATVNDANDGHRRAISNLGSGDLSFPPGFEATHAIAIDVSFGGLWSIPATGNIGGGGLGFVDGVGSPTTAGDASFAFSFDWSEIGLSSSDSLTFLATYGNPNANSNTLMFSSDEAFGRGVSASNPGGGVFSFDTYFVYPSGEEGGEARTNAAGNWSAPGTWLNGNLPLNGDIVYIDHDVDLDVSPQVDDGLEISTGNDLDVNAGESLSLTSGVSGAGTLTVNGTLRIEGGGFTSIVPTYNSGSTLTYASGTTYGRGTEWSNTTGAGYPQNVTLTNSTTLNLGANGGTATARQLAGDLTIESGSTLSLAIDPMSAALTVLGTFQNDGTVDLSTASGGDLILEGDFVDNGIFNANSRAVFFQGNNGQDINSTTDPLDIDVMRINKGGGEVRLLQNLRVDETNDPLQFISATSFLNLNGQSLTLGQDGISSSITYTAGAGFRGTTTSTMILEGDGSVDLVFDASADDLGALTVSRANAGDVTLSSTLDVSGDITLEEGSLILSSANQLSGDLLLEGGSLSTGSTSGNSESLGSVDLNASSTIDLGSGSHSLNFAASNTETWIGAALLTINNWSGTAGTSGSGTDGQIFFGSDNTALTSQQLSQIQFAGFPQGAVLTGSGELVPEFEALPTVNSSLLTASDIGRTVMTLNWTVGNGSNRIVVAREGAAVSFNPSNGTVYLANSDFSAATALDADNNKVLYQGNGNSFSISGLNPDTTYHFAVFEYNGANGTAAYLGTLTGSFNTTQAFPTVSTGPVAWNTAASWLDGIVPSNGDAVIIRATTNLNVNREVSGVTLEGGAQLIVVGGQNLALTGSATGGSNGDIIVNGTLTLRNGGSLAFSPLYNAGSALIYDGVTNYGAGSEWATALASGNGVPETVDLINNASLNFGAATGYRQVNGDFTIGPGSSLTLSSAAGGDLRIGGAGDWINNNTTVGAGFVSNNRAIRFVGNANQRMENASGTTTVGYLLNEKTGGDLVLDNDLILDGMASGTANVLQLLTTSPLDLNGFAITIAGDQSRAIEVAAAASIVSNAGASDLTFAAGTGNAAVLSISSGTLSIGANVAVEINKGVDFDSHTSIAGSLTLEDGSFCVSSPTYAGGSTLIYQTGNFNAGNEWLAGAGPGIGLPDNVSLNLDNAQDSLSSFGTSVTYVVPGTLTLNQGKLSINAGATVRAETIANNATLRVLDDGSLLQTGGTDNNSGSGTYEIRRFVEATDMRRYNYWSSPLDNLTFGPVFGSTSSSPSNAQDWYFWNVATQQWSNSGDLNNASPLATGQGYATTPTPYASQNPNPVLETRQFSGSDLHNGPLTQSYNVQANDFILVGNPYPSALSLTNFFGGNADLTGTAYFWDDRGAFGNRGYASWNGSGATRASGGPEARTPNGFVSTAQGFFVASNVTSTSLAVDFDNTMRAAGNNDQFFKAAQLRQRAWLTLTNDSTGFNEILVSLDPNASMAYDQGLDGRIFKAHSQLAFYSLIDGEEYSIQALPLASNEQVIPLGVDAWVTGQYTIALDSLDNWGSGQAIYLLDSAQSRSVDLQQKSYTFAVNQSGSMAGRFYLKLGAVGIELPEAENNGEFAYYQRGTDLVLDDALSQWQPRQVGLYGLGGQSLRQEKWPRGTEQFSLSLSSLPSGVYLLQVEAADGSVNHFKVYFRKTL